MAKKMTREERQQERERTEALEFRAEVERVRDEVVIESDSRLHGPGSEALERRFGQEMVSALYRVLSEVRRLRSEYETKVGWLEDKVADARRYLAENRFYASTPFQNVDDLHMTYGRLYENLQAAASLCRALNVYCPMLHDETDAKTRTQLLSYSVLQETDGLWRVKRGADYATAFDDGQTELPGYGEEWQAWRVVQMLVHGR